MPATPSHFEVFAKAPWGSGRGEFPCVTREWPIFAEMVPEQMRLIRAGARLKLRPDLGVLAFPEWALHPSKGERAFVCRFDAAGRWEATSWLPELRDRAVEALVLDVVEDEAQGLYVAARLRSGGGVSEGLLGRISPNGELSWVLNNSPAITGEAAQVILGTRHHGNDAHLIVVNKDRGTVTFLEHKSGDTVSFEKAKVDLSGSFQIKSANLYFVAYLPDRNEKVVRVLDLVSGACSPILEHAGLSALLDYPIGIDGLGAILGWSGSAVVRLHAGESAKLATFSNIAVRWRDGAVYWSEPPVKEDRSLSISVTGRTAAGTTAVVRCNIPVELWSESDFRLVHVDDTDRLHVFGGEGPAQPGTLLIYSATGRLESVVDGSADLFSIECRSAGYRSWQADHNGRTYVPITCPEGVAIVRLLKSEGGRAPLAEGEVS